MKQILFSILFILIASTSYAQKLSQDCPSQNPCHITSISAPAPSEQIHIEKLLTQHNIFIIVLSFLGLGLLLAFTPCILPMVPILSGILIGHHKKNPSTIKAFSLSFAYVAGMAIAYAIAGMIAALIGSRIQTGLQKPWIIVLFSSILVLMALSLFGLYEFQLPGRWHKKLTHISNKQKSGTYLGVFLMGSISSLIVSPCISPALVGVLTYIAHTGDAWLGAIALFSLGIGMGLPLLLAGTSLAKFLPKTGAWMQTIEHIVGVMMLGLAIWLLLRIIPAPETRQIHQPLFTTVSSMTQFNQKLAEAKQEKKWVILDFYADWCAVCLDMDHFLFTQQNVKKTLDNFVLLRANISDDNTFDEALMNRFKVIAPPTLLFFTPTGKELTDERLIGDTTDNELITQIQELKENTRVHSP